MWIGGTCSIGLMISVMRNCVMSHNYFLTQLPGRINQKFCFYCSFQWDDKIVSGGKVHKTFLSVPTFSAHEWQVLIFWSNLGRTEPFALWNSWREGIAIFLLFHWPVWTYYMVAGVQKSLDVLLSWADPGDHVLQARMSWFFDPSRQML